jgi:hypothetical protein
MSIDLSKGNWQMTMQWWSMAKRCRYNRSIGCFDDIAVAIPLITFHRSASIAGEFAPTALREID